MVAPCKLSNSPVSKGMQKITHKSGKISRLFNLLAYEVTLYLQDVIEQFSYKSFVLIGKVKNEHRHRPLLLPGVQVKTRIGLLLNCSSHNPVMIQAGAFLTLSLDYAVLFLSLVVVPQSWCSGAG